MPTSVSREDMKSGCDAVDGSRRRDRELPEMATPGPDIYRLRMSAPPLEPGFPWRNVRFLDLKVRLP